MAGSCVRPGGSPSGPTRSGRPPDNDEAADTGACLRHAENWYAQRRQPVIFQLTRRPENAALEEFLDGKGYSRQSETIIMTAGPSPAAQRGAGGISVTFTDTAPDQWLDLWWSVDGRGGEAEKQVARGHLVRGAVAVRHRTQQRRGRSGHRPPLSRGWLGWHLRHGHASRLPPPGSGGRRAGRSHGTRRPRPVRKTCGSWSRTPTPARKNSTAERDSPRLAATTTARPRCAEHPAPAKNPPQTLSQRWGDLPNPFAPWHGGMQRVCSNHAIDAKGLGQKRP